MENLHEIKISDFSLKIRRTGITGAFIPEGDHIWSPEVCLSAHHTHMSIFYLGFLRTDLAPVEPRVWGYTLKTSQRRGQKRSGRMEQPRQASPGRTENKDTLGHQEGH